jgi:hypothetical protein
MKKNVFESGPKYLGALTWNHPAATAASASRLHSISFQIVTYDEHFEICSLVGTLSSGSVL